MPLSFRSATEDDLDRLVDIHLVAYPDDRSGEVRRRNFTANAFGDLSDVFVALDGDEIRGHARLFRMQSWFGARRVKLGGVASVAVAPEARGQGVATALVEHLHARAGARGDAVTLLYPFRHAFYARLGYAPTSSRKRLAVDPTAIPREHRLLARAMVGRVTGDDRKAIERAYTRTAERSTGWLARRPLLWDRLFARERRQILAARRGKKIVGYVAFEVGQAEAHGETRLAVEELVSDDAEAKRALWGALGNMGDQVAEIDIEVAEDDPIEHALLDPDRRRHGTEAVEHGIGELVAGPMVRIVDLARALTARGYDPNASGSFQLVVDDEAFPLTIAGGTAALIGARRMRDTIRVSRRGLASVLYGGLRLETAVALGLAEADDATAARVGALLAIPPMFPVDPF